MTYENLESNPLSALKEQAEVLKRGLEAGYVQPAEIVAWADREIDICDVPGPELIEVSLGGGLYKDELARALGAIPGEACDTKVVQSVIRSMSNALQCDPTLGQCIVHELYDMLLEDLISSPEAKAQIYRLDDAFDMAESGTWGSIAEAQADLKEFLSGFS